MESSVSVKMPSSSTAHKMPGFMQLMNRLLGDWPLFGKEVPLSSADMKALWRAHPAFVNYLPFNDYNPKERVFEFNDGVSVGAVFRVYAADMDAKSSDVLEEFNEKINHALAALPQDDRYPYVAQIYLEDREPANIADWVSERTDPEIRQTKFSQAWFAALRSHFDMMLSAKGIYADERIPATTSETKGWRAIERQIHICLFRKAPEAEWRRRQRYTPAEQLNRAIAPFETALMGAGVKMQRINDTQLQSWLLPWLTPIVPGYDSPQDYLRNNKLPHPDIRGAGFDLARQCLHTPPTPITDRDDETDIGVYRFGDTYTRYVTLQGVDRCPADGLLMVDRQNDADVTACPWDQLPPESIFSWTIIPRSQEAIDRHLDYMDAQVSNTTSDGARAASYQVDEAKAARRQHQQIFNVQMGVYLRAESLQRLDERTLQLEGVLTQTVMRPIPAKYDLIADDAFVRNLPMVYSWHHERNHAKRSRLTYTAHLASLLPFYGRSTGTENPCFVMYRRDGQVFTINPFHPFDRSRVAHSVLFGPTGSGKSATAIAMAMQSMAVNRPRQIIIEKGNSFGLLGDFYRANGLQVRRMEFVRSDEDISYPPYVETANALAEHRGEINDLATESDDDDRSYLAEMLHMTELMITGGREQELAALTSPERMAIQDALIRALETSEEQGKPHAIPSDVVDALHHAYVHEELDVIKLSLRKMHDAMKLWTKGPRGRFFNQYGKSFSDDDDVIHIDLGVLTATGSEDMLALAILSMLTNITAWSERLQGSGRHFEVWFDEGHYVSGTPLTIKGFVVGTKVWRKLNTWLVFATQDFSDFTDDARKILSQAEFWYLLSMGASEASQVARFRELSDDEKWLLGRAIKQPGKYVEGVMLSEKFPAALLRFVPPALALALAQTEGDEKSVRQSLAQERGITELEAALLVAEKISQKRQGYGD